MKALSMFVLAAIVINCGALVLPDSAQPVLSEDNLLSGFVRVDPDDKKPELLPTQAWLWQDGSDLVVRFAARIDSTFSKGTLSVRDEGTIADFLRVQLITIPDAYYAYYYAAYPLGNLHDGVRNTDMSTDYAWDSHYSYASDIAGDTWQVTMRIPLEELRFKQSKPYNWKIILTRYHQQKDEFYSLPYANTNTGKDYFLKAQDIVLSTPVKHKLDISFKPYFVKSYDLIARTGSYDPEHVGLDIALNPGQRTRIKLSFNPDFSDVPMDDAQDNYNSKYPPYYSENRFFFTEDIEAFGVDYDVFDSRNIVQPRLAVKATGNTSWMNWGALGAFDKEIKDGEELINSDDYYQVLALNPSWRRLQMFNAAVSRMNAGYYNHVYSGSAKWEYLPHLYVSGVLNLTTLKNDPAGVTEPLTGNKFGFGLSADPKNFDISVGYLRLSKDLAYDAGYLYETDYEYVGGSFGWNKTYGERKVRYAQISSWAYGYHKDLSLDPYYSYESGMTANLNLASKFNFLANCSAARVPDLNDDLHNVYNGMLGCTWNKLNNIRIFGGYLYGKQLVYALSDVYSQQRISINTAMNPLQKLAVSLSASWNIYGYDKQLLPGTNLVLLDEEYVIANASLEYTPRNSFKISMGSGISTYESAGNTASLSGYGNLRYEFKPEMFLYLGFKSAQTQVEPSHWSDPLGRFRKDLSTVYAKLGLTI